MSINLNPTGIFPSYEYSASGSPSSSTDGFYIELSDVHELSANEANDQHANADYRKLVWGILDSTYSAINAKDAGDRPSNMTITRSAISFIDDDTAQRSYTVTFKYNIGGYDIEDEV